MYRSVFNCMKGTGSAYCQKTYLLHTQSHAGKVVLRSWYERNKHIFPASRWEPYDPEKNWGAYSVSSVMYWHFCGILKISFVFLDC